MTSLTAIHRSVLAEIGIDGIEPEKLLRHGREFQELERLGLIVFWPKGGVRPQGIFGGGFTAGRWYLTAEGVDAIGPDLTPLRFS
jgi:hypothetical protein